MLKLPGDLRWPFVAASASIVALSVSYEVFGSGRFSRINPLTAGVVVGTLLVVAVYAIVRQTLDVTRWK